MPNPWFRMYSEFAHDPKVQNMSEPMQRRLLMLFCATCEEAIDTWTDEDIAFQWRLSEDEVAKTKALFTRKGFIEDGWSVVNWNRRQFLSDTSTDRTRRYRERRRTSHVTVSVTPVTKCDGLEQIQNRIEAETEEKTFAPSKLDAGPDSESTSGVQDASLRGDDRSPKKAKAKVAPDARHAEFREILNEYWTSKNAGIEMPWDGSEGKALSLLLRANPNLDGLAFRTLLRNRFKSQVNHAERPRAWIERVTDYAGGPLSQFKQPREEHGISKAASPATVRVNSASEALKAAVKRRGWGAPGAAAAADDPALPAPGPKCIDGLFDYGLRSAVPEVRAAESRSGVDGATDPPRSGLLAATERSSEGV